MTIKIIKPKQKEYNMDFNNETETKIQDEQPKVIVVASSPKAAVRIKSFEDKVGTETRDSWALLPIWELRIGQSFVVPIRAVCENSVRANCCGQAKKLGKKVTVIKHNGDQNPLGEPCLEIARIG
jgi:hypothetical protein